MEEPIKYIFTDEEEQPKKKNKPGAGRPLGASKKNRLKFDNIQKLYSYGFTDEEVANFLDVTVETIYNWKKDKNFFKILMAGKALPDAEVARSLYQRAIGYSHPEVDIRVVDKEIVKTKIIKHYPPDVGAATLWLKNRQPDKWKDKRDVELSGGGSIPVTMTIIHESKKPPDEKD